MSPHSWNSVLLSAVAVLAALDGSSAPPAPKRTATAAPQTSRGAAKPVNLLVLPRNSTAAEIEDLMESYNAELGVSCEYCHTRNSSTQQPDYVSDDNPAKQTARVMISMLNDINTKYLAQLDDSKYAVLVSCGNCHRGQSDPPEFEPAPRALANAKPPGK